MTSRSYVSLTPGQRIRLTRVAIGVTQRAVAKALGITREAVTQYETGSRFPKWEHAISMCDSWELSLDWIARGDISQISPGLQRSIEMEFAKGKHLARSESGKGRR